MNILKRISNVWKLSELEPDIDIFLPESGPEYTHMALIIKKPQQKAEFIPYKKVDPIQELILEKP